MMTKYARRTMKLNPRFPWQKQHSKRRRFFPPESWTWS